MINTIAALQQQLDLRADPKTKGWWEGYLKHVIPFRGVKMADIRAVLHQWVKEEGIDRLSMAQRNAVQAAKAVIAEAEQVTLSERDSLRVLNTLEDPPPPNAKLLAAARALSILSHLHLAGGSAQAQV